MILSIIALAGLLVLSAFFSATETAFTSLSAMQVQELSVKKGTKGRLVKLLSQNPDILLTTILLGNNLVNITASAIAAKLTIELYGSRALGISTGVLTLVILIFAEVTPKRIALIHNEYICTRTAHFIYALSFILRPFIWFAGFTSLLITRFFTKEKKKDISLEGILHIVNIARDMGVVESYETEMVKNVFRFNDVPVNAVMTHRTDVFSLNEDLKLKDAINKIIESGFSRIPVYNKDPEEIEGIVIVKDIIKRISEGSSDVKLKTIMIKPFFVSDTKKINELFFQFKNEKLNMAIVMDEYGGLAGIVTQEDVVEEILGELYDENEKKDKGKITPMQENRYRVAGDISLYQLKDTLGIKLPHQKRVQTLAGYITNISGHIPKTGEVISVPGAELQVEKISKNRIISVICTPAK